MFRRWFAVVAVLVSVSAFALADLLDDTILNTGLTPKLTDGLYSDFDRDDDDRSYSFYPYRVPVRLGGSVHVASVPDLVNLIMGLGGHVVGRTGWIIHDAIRSLGEGVATSRYRLTDDDGFFNRYKAGYASPKDFDGLDDIDGLKF